MPTTTTSKTATATATATEPVKQCKVTNSSGTDIVVGTPITSDETENTKPIVSFNKDFEILYTASGGTVIKNGSTDTVTLDRTHLDATTKQPVYSKGYDLLISSSTWLTPIANLGVAMNPISKVFKPQTVTADSATAMQQAASFYQTIAAYPTSKLAKDYMASMNATNDDADSKADGSPDSATNVGDSIEGGVAGFFAGTKSYQKVTLPGIVALEAYYNMFPFVWANYADSTTYYLYSSDGKATSFQGALSMKKSGPIDITKANGGYTCSFAPAVTPSDTSKTDVNTAAAKTLTYSDGVFTDDTNADIPQIALKGAFSLKRTFTKDPNDTKIIVIISGTINGATCLGFDQTQATTPDDSTQDWLNSLFHPTTAAGIFNSVMQILGALMMLHFVGTLLYGIVKWARGKGANGEAVKAEDVKAQKESFSSETKAKIDSIYEKLNGDKNAKTPETSEDALNTAAENQSTLSDQVSSGQVETNVDKISDNLSQLEELTATDTTKIPGTNETLNDRVEAAGDKLGDAWDGFSNNPDVKQALSDIQPEMKDLQSQMVDLNTKVADKVSDDQKADYDENVENMKDVQTDMENQEKTEENEDADGEDADPDAEGIDFPDV